MYQWNTYAALEECRMLDEEQAGEGKTDTKDALRKNCSYSEFSPNAGKHGTEQLRIQTLSRSEEQVPSRNPKCCFPVR